MCDRDEGHGQGTGRDDRSCRRARARAQLDAGAGVGGVREVCERVGARVDVLTIYAHSVQYMVHSSRTILQLEYYE